MFINFSYTYSCEIRNGATLYITQSSHINNELQSQRQIGYPQLLEWH